MAESKPMAGFKFLDTTCSNYCCGQRARLCQCWF